MSEPTEKAISPATIPRVVISKIPINTSSFVTSEHIKPSIEKATTENATEK